MLKVYAAKWCPHCVRTIQFLHEKEVEFEYIEVEEQSPSVIAELVKENGGHDWVVPTLELNGAWRPGQVFHPGKLEKYLIEMGLI
jgi:mycoredoxin